MNVLVCATGSVAAMKTPVLCEELRRSGHTVPLVLTKSARFFIDCHYKDQVLRAYEDKDEWKDTYKLGEPVLHINLRAWADILVIAPCSANSLAKLSYGLADNLVTCIARAWDFSKPMFVAPAMNTMMWEHPFTKEHCSRLESIGVCIINPVEKTLACGDRGIGAMADCGVIADRINQFANL